MNDPTVSRLVMPALEDRLRVMPAVVLTGARQAGKSTLARDIISAGRRFFTLDDLDTFEAARNDPDAILGGNDPITIDEVQRAPDLLHAVKMDIDNRRTPGRFLLTGSANLLLMGQVSESLAGRASYLTLLPLTRREQMGLGRAGLWEELLGAPDEEWRHILNAAKSPREDWRKLALRGGFPTPALSLRSARERAIWFDGYTQTYLERDLLSLSTIAALPDFRRLMRATCLRIGQLVNQTDLGRDVALSQPTVRRHLNLLETSHLLVRVPAYAVNRTKRLIKAPKIYWADTGLAMRIAQEDVPRGAHLENLVLIDLLAWRDARDSRADIFYWRTTAGEEVDFIIEADDRLLPIEVKSTTKPSLRDAAALRSFRREYGDSARAGLLLHDGDMLDWLTPDVLAVPWWMAL